MPKTAMTLAIENALHTMCRQKRIYGCEEITIGFPNNGHGNEIVDFMTMDSRGILRCYEIKISMADLRSKAKKSWYGNYNYLVVTEELYKKIKDWAVYIPDFVGVSVYELSWNGMAIVNKRHPVKQDLTSYQQLMVKEGFIRSLAWKVWKLRYVTDLEYIKKMQDESKEWKRKYERERKARDRDWKEIEDLKHTIEEYRRR